MKKRIPPMVERATAKALKTKFKGRLIGKTLNREVVQAVVIATMKAMRNPTKPVIELAGMAEIGSCWVADHGKGYDEDVTFPICIALLDTGCREPAKAVLAIWREMLDAALEAKHYHKPAVADDSIPF